MSEMEKSYGKARKSLGYGPSASKARQMLKDGTAQGQPLTGKQKRFFGAIVGRSKKK